MKSSPNSSTPTPCPLFDEPPSSTRSSNHTNQLNRPSFSIRPMAQLRHRQHPNTLDSFIDFTFPLQPTHSPLPLGSFYLQRHPPSRTPSHLTSSSSQRSTALDHLLPSSDSVILPSTTSPHSQRHSRESSNVTEGGSVPTAGRYRRARPFACSAERASALV